MEVGGINLAWGVNEDSSKLNFTPIGAVCRPVDKKLKIGL